MAQRTDISLEPQKAHLTGEFVIVAKFGGHTLCRLASRLVNVIRQGGRQIFFLKSFKLLQMLHSFMHTISGFSNVKAV